MSEQYELKSPGKGNRSKNRGKPPRKTTPEQEAEICDKYLSGHYTVTSISDEYKVHFGTISKIVKRERSRRTGNVS